MSNIPEAHTHGSSSMKKRAISLWKFEGAWLVTTPVNQELTDARGGFSGSKRLYQCQGRASF